MDSKQLSVNFEPTSSWCRRFALNTVLPEIALTPEVSKGTPFRLVNYVSAVMNKYLTNEQLRTEYIRPESGKPIAVAASIKFWCGWTSKYGKRSPFIHEGDGLYRLASEEDAEVEEFDTNDTADIQASTGYIYAYTFPSLIKTNTDFPIKIGMTTTDVKKRVFTQCQTAGFEEPSILGQWQVTRVENVEDAVHKILCARGKLRENAIGTEWFNTTIDEVKNIVEFICQTHKP